MYPLRQEGNQLPWIIMKYHVHFIIFTAKMLKIQFACEWNTQPVVNCSQDNIFFDCSNNWTGKDTHKYTYAHTHTHTHTHTHADTKHTHRQTTHKCTSYRQTDRNTDYLWHPLKAFVRLDPSICYHPINCYPLRHQPITGWLVNISFTKTKTITKPRGNPGSLRMRVRKSRESEKQLSPTATIWQINLNR